MRSREFWVSAGLAAARPTWRRRRLHPAESWEEGSASAPANWQSAAIVSRPSGGWTVSSGMCSIIPLKLQKEDENCGQIIRALTAAPKGAML